MFFLLGVGDDDVLALAGRSRPSPARARPRSSSRSRPTRWWPGPSPLGTAVVAVEPRARWERLYRLVDHVFEHHGDRADPLHDSGTDLFGLAQSIADRTHGMVSIEDVQSHVLAYSASNDEADELRRLSILGRAGPPEHLEWIGQWGIFDALRASGDVVRVDASARNSGCGRGARSASTSPRRIARRRAACSRAPSGCSRVRAPLADDADDVLRGAAVLAARIMSRLAAAPSTHAVRVQELLGLRAADSTPTSAAVARELGIVVDGRVAVDRLRRRRRHARRLADVLALSASAFRRDAQVASTGRPGLRAVPAHRHGVVGDVVDPRHHRRAAPRAGPDAASRDRHSAERVWPAPPRPAPRWTACSTAPNATRAPSVR